MSDVFDYEVKYYSSDYPENDRFIAVFNRIAESMKSIETSLHVIAESQRNNFIRSDIYSAIKHGETDAEIVKRMRDVLRKDPFNV